MTTAHTSRWRHGRTSTCAILLIAIAALTSGCQRLQGERDGDTYYAPAAAYAVDLSINTFRGKVTLEERCDAHSGSTTFWDGSGRMFRIDYHRAESNPNFDTPRFASDLTLMNLVLNHYLRDKIAPTAMITSVEAAHREFLQDATPRSLFAIVGLDVDPSRQPEAGAVGGRHYYGFLLFKQGEMIYVVQHRQPVLMPEKMKSVLLHLAEAMAIPGRERSASEMERLRRLLARMAPGVRGPERLCSPD
ncbi:hypothetical protein K8B33_09395 [Alcanivorax sp. JB21]|uniref:hypothetical protein n=1 Tax=Alcanivorax limicola TaxID=2874102 RepID=UPI001CC111FD|nr:hypothetical protein [Alcanivorax limicola]MBZ2189311.1 hypothetical protein [Alcanivorax limicola]